MNIVASKPQVKTEFTTFVCAAARSINSAYIVARGSAVGKYSGVAFTVWRGLEALSCFDLCQQLRVVTGGGHHVERLCACRTKKGERRRVKPGRKTGRKQTDERRREGGWHFSVQYFIQ